MAHFETFLDKYVHRIIADTKRQLFLLSSWIHLFNGDPDVFPVTFWPIFLSMFLPRPLPSSRALSAVAKLPGGHRVAAATLEKKSCHPTCHPSYTGQLISFVLLLLLDCYKKKSEFSVKSPNIKFLKNLTVVAPLRPVD